MAVGPRTGAKSSDAASGGSSTEKKKRSKSFPTLALPDAIAIIEVAGSNGMEHSLTAFAKYCGHQTANSGPFKQKISSFKDWKLVSVNDDKVTITDSSRPLILRRDPSSVAEATRAAFMSCDTMANFYDATAKGVPYAVADLKRHAVVDFEVSSESSDSFAKSVAKSAIAAGLAEPTDEEGGVKFKSAKDVTNGQQPQPGEQTSPESVRSRQVSSPHARETEDQRDVSDAPIVVRQRWETKGGSVTFEIRSREPIDADAFAAVGSIVKEAGALAQALGVPEDAGIGTA